jgi:hypothetical protein
MVTCFLEKKGYDDFVFLDGCNVFLSKNHVWIQKRIVIFSYDLFTWDFFSNLCPYSKSETFFSNVNSGC